MFIEDYAKKVRLLSSFTRRDDYGEAIWVAGTYELRVAGGWYYIHQPGNALGLEAVPKDKYELVFD